MRRLGEAVEARALGAGALLFDAGEMPDGVFVIRDGHVRVTDEEDTLLGEAGPGNAVGGRRLLRGEPNPIRARAITDSALLVVPADLFRDLAARHAVIRDFFRSGPTRQNRPVGLHSMAVSDLMTCNPVTLSPSMSVAEAARRMRDSGISSVLVGEARAVQGIVTVRDISARVVAEGLDPAAPLSRAMSEGLITLPPDAAGSDVLHLMMERGISHVPIIEGGRLVGIVSKTDLTRVQSESTAEVIGDAAGAPDIAALARIAGRIPSLLAQLASAGYRHETSTRYITDIADAVTRRLLALAEAKFGPPPVSYVWAACGSQGRQEQTGVSDQDNVLILSNEADEDDDRYFAQLARFVSDGLNRCGYVFCPGDMMATNPRWRKRLSSWHDDFRRWIERPVPEAQLLASVMFDLRPIGGARELFEELHTETMARAARNSFFGAHMTTQALSHQPPLGLFRSLVTLRSGEHRATIDMKRSGVVPVVDLARVYAIRGGLLPVNTRARIEAAREVGSVSKTGGRDLLDAYDVIAEARLAHQAAQIRGGTAPDNYMSPGQLSPFERSHLRNAFLVVRTMQSAAGQRRGIL